MFEPCSAPLADYLACIGSNGSVPHDSVYTASVTAHPSHHSFESQTRLSRFTIYHHLSPQQSGCS
jgi:hypothetical protein